MLRFLLFPLQQKAKKTRQRIFCNTCFVYAAAKDRKEDSDLSLALRCRRKREETANVETYILIL